MPRVLTSLLLDLDGVLRLWSPDNDARAERATGLPSGAIRKIAFADDLALPAITGRISDEQWRQLVSERLGREHPGVDAQLAIRLWSESAGEVNEPVHALIRACRPKARIALLSNATSRLLDDLARLGLLALFDQVINSSAVGAPKPNARIFTVALEALGVQASDTFFTDDHAENVRAAESLGIVGHVFSTPEALREALEAHGLL